jgi:DNA-binding IscR family transcriptional regulator
MQRMQPVSISLPKKPKIKQKEQQPDLRHFAVVPFRAITDRSITEMQLRVLLMLCAYSNRAGLTWVGLKRIADHFGISLNRAAVLTRALIKAGYVKVIYYGFKGERAHTRQIIYKSDLTLADIVAISGESAPFMQENQQPTGAKGETMAKRKTGKVNDQVISNLDLNDSDSHLGLDSQLEAIRKAVGSEIFAAAQQQAGAAATPADIERILAKMLT